MKKQKQSLSTKDYLQAELKNDIKHEWIDGIAHEMAGASVNHERICQNIARHVGNHLQDSRCEPFGSGMKVRVRDNFYYPDVMVDCSFDEATPYFSETPVLIVEVVSRSTRKMDEKIKLIDYINIDSLQEYVLVEQDVADVTVYRKNDDWRCTHYFLGEKIHFDSIDLTILVDDIYQRVKNEDVKLYIKEKQIKYE